MKKFFKKFFIDLRGITRIVILTPWFVIKIANFRHQHNHFLKGCIANWNERHYTKLWKNNSDLNKLITPSYFCSWFGVIQIQALCEPNNEYLTDEQKKMYEPLCGTDNKPQNFGYYKGNLVCLDYGS